jgi:purine-cytosine permease-like protein
MRLIIIRGIDNRLTEIDINFVSMIVIFTAAVIPVYIAKKLNNNNNNNSHTGNNNNNNPNLKKLAVMLAAFILAHGVYHITRFLGFTLLAEGVFEPLSITILIAFGVLLYYNNTTGKKERKEEARA